MTPRLTVSFLATLLTLGGCATLPLQGVDRQPSRVDAPLLRAGSAPEIADAVFSTLKGRFAESMLLKDESHTTGAGALVLLERPAAFVGGFCIVGSLEVAVRPVAEGRRRSSDSPAAYSIGSVRSQSRYVAIGPFGDEGEFDTTQRRGAQRCNGLATAKDSFSSPLDTAQLFRAFGALEKIRADAKANRPLPKARCVENSLGQKGCSDPREVLANLQLENLREVVGCAGDGSGAGPECVELIRIASRGQDWTIKVTTDYRDLVEITVAPFVQIVLTAG